MGIDIEPDMYMDMDAEMSMYMNPNTTIDSSIYIDDTSKEYVYQNGDITVTYSYEGGCNQCEEVDECYVSTGCSTKKCTTGINGDTALQTQKIIQNTVRMYASLYTMNLASLSAYKKPLDRYQVVEQAGTFYYTPPGVCWNQMSDRPVPSNQRAYVPTSFNNSLNSRHHSVTSSRPGCQSPGGIGVDIKHNSYDRYLNRIKGKKPLRAGLIPPTYGLPLAFNNAYPIYGNKLVKTGVIDRCNCLP
jgi:hypothetical protein